MRTLGGGSSAFASFRIDPLVEPAITPHCTPAPAARSFTVLGDVKRRHHPNSKRRTHTLEGIPRGGKNALLGKTNNVILEDPRLSLLSKLTF